VSSRCSVRHHRCRGSVGKRGTARMAPEVDGASRQHRRAVATRRDALRHASPGRSGCPRWRGAGRRGGAATERKWRWPSFRFGAKEVRHASDSFATPGALLAAATFAFADSARPRHAHAGPTTRCRNRVKARAQPSLSSKPARSCVGRPQPSRQDIDDDRYGTHQRRAQKVAANRPVKSRARFVPSSDTRILHQYRFAA
jgi:hypothetical protein